MVRKIMFNIYYGKACDYVLYLHIIMLFYPNELNE